MDKETVTNIVEFVKVSGELLEEYQQKIAALENQVAVAEKEAAVASEANKAESRRDAFDPARISGTVENMAKAGFIKKAEREKAIKQISEDPAVLFDYLDGLAEREASTVKPMARVAANRAPKPADRESDRVFEQTFRKLRY
jgi:hypothetical protein